mgnify:CR=1 FL=1
MPAPATRTAWAAAADKLAGRHPVTEMLHERHGVPTIGPGPRPGDRFRSIAESITYQQLAGRAAATIWGRVLDTVGTPFCPEAVLDTPLHELRAAGLSGAKSAALVDLATRCRSGELQMERIARMSDAAVIEHLTAVRGIGPWTAQMFLLFDLRRLDVWPTGDLGVRAGFTKAFGHSEMVEVKELAELGAQFAPYRSVLAWWCWRETDTVTPSS